ncbi:MAG: V-type ATP synthase subunit E [Candidatus Hydrogenedentales bacterium]
MSLVEQHSDPAAALFETMKRDARERCESIRDEAREEARRIINEARRSAGAKREKMLEQERRSVEAHREDSRRRAQSEAERASMAVREQVVDRILDEVHEALSAIVEGAGFPALVCRLLAEVMEEAPGDPVVLAPPAHTAACRHWLDAHGRATVPVEADERLWDGVAVTDSARSFRLTNTLTGRFEKCRPNARKAALQRLFGGQP